MNTLQVEVVNGPAGRPLDRAFANVPSAITMLAAVPADALSNAVRETIALLGRAVIPAEDGPESCTLKFALKISADGGVILAKVGSELNLEVSVTWKR